MISTRRIMSGVDNILNSSSNSSVSNNNNNNNKVAKPMNLNLKSANNLISPLAVLPQPSVVNMMTNNNQKYIKNIPVNNNKLVQPGSQFKQVYSSMHTGFSNGKQMLNNGRSFGRVITNNSNNNNNRPIGFSLQQQQYQRVY